MSEVNIEKAYPWHQLIGIGYETVFGTYVAPTDWFPKKELTAITRKQDTIKGGVEMGTVLRKGQYDILGLDKSQAKINMPQVQYNGGIARLLAQIFTVVTTSVEATGVYSHIMKLRTEAGVALNMDAGISITEPRDGVVHTMAGGRIVGFELTQEQNKFAELSFEIEGAATTMAADTTTPALATLLSTYPFLKFSRLAFAVGGGDIQNIVSLKFAVKLKHTADDNMQPLGAVARTAIDISGVESMVVTCKRRYIKDDNEGGNLDSYLKRVWAEKTPKDISMIYTGEFIDDPHRYQITFVLPCCRIEKEDDIKVTEEGGVIYEESTWTAHQPEPGDDPNDPIIVSVYDASATPATQA